LKLEKKIAKWSDEKVLETFYALLDRASISTRFIHDENGILTHHSIVVTSGDKFFMSSPQPVDWPLMPVPTPEGNVH